MLRGAWKNHLCLLLPMKVSITTQGYHHNLQRHEIHGEPRQAQAQQSILSNPHLCSAWDAPVHILHGSSMTYSRSSYFGFGELARQAFWRSGKQAWIPREDWKKSVKLGHPLRTLFHVFFFLFFGNQCFKQCRVFGINEMPFMWYFLFSFTCLQYLAVYTFGVESAIMSGLGKWSLQFERGWSGLEADS